MTQLAHKQYLQNRIQTMRFSPFLFTGKAPRKGKRIPLNEIKYNEQRDKETGYGYFGARYMDHELMTMWLSVDPMMDEYPGLSPYNYCIWNPAKLNDPNGEDPVFFGLLQYQGIAKFGNSHLGETQQIGNFLVTPFYDNNNNLLGYNAGRYRSDGSFVNEYQMGPGDIKMFSQNVKTYEDAANLVYCAGEPDWSYVAFGSYLTTGNYHAALSELGKMWGDALKDPGFWFSTAISITGIGARLPNINSTGQTFSNKINSLQKQINKHQRKLGDYLSNPVLVDNKGLLNGASYTKFKSIFEGRIKHLEHEIRIFKRDIEKERKNINGGN